MFSRKQQPTPEVPAPDTHDADAGKGRPTPKRKEAEAANRRPLVPSDRQAAAKAQREQAREQRDREYQALRTGDDRYLPIRDKGPQRRWIRDVVDSRWSLGEFFLPVAIVLMVAMMVFGKNLAALQLITIILYSYVLLAIADAAFMAGRLRRRLAEKYGAGQVQRGSLLYAITRVMQIRQLRLPKPQVERGQKDV